MNKDMKFRVSRKARLLSLVLCFVMIVSACPFTAFAAEQGFDGDYAEGEVIISCEKEINDILDAEAFEDIDIVSVERVETYSDDFVYSAKIDGDVEKTCRKLNRISGISAEPNFVFETNGFQFPLEVTNNIQLYDEFQKSYINDILHLPGAWEKNEVSGEGVTLALIDSGFYLNATDFPTNLWENSLGTVGWNVHNDNDDISPIYKSNGELFTSGQWATQHGSNLAGAIGMAANGIGGIGAAYGAELMLIKAASYKDDTNVNVLMDDVIEALDFARENGADIINFSLSTSSKSDIFHDAVNRAYDAGIAIIASAANYGKGTSTSLYYPSSYDNVISVMAIDTKNPTHLADFSNYDDTADHTYYDIAAPGTYIVGCDVVESSLTSYNGTSQACAFVSACAALYLEKYPDATVDDLYDAIRNFPADCVSSYQRAGVPTYQFRAMDAVKFLDYCNHNRYNDKVISEATCTRSGKIRHTCAVCGYSYTETVRAFQHTWSEWETEVYPAEGTDGVSSCRCLTCGETKTVTLPAQLTIPGNDGDIIPGIEPFMSVSDFTESCLAAGCDVEVEAPVAGVLGTGSKLTVNYPDGSTVEYTVSVTGDTDGDSSYGAADSIIVRCIASGMLSRDQVGEAVWNASDVNHDGVIDDTDVAVLEQAGLILSIGGSEGGLSADEAYIEFISLLDRNITADKADTADTEKPAEEPVDAGFNKSFIQRIIDFMIYLFNMIKSFIVK